jgi:uncharacterized membrane protein
MQRSVSTDRRVVEPGTADRLRTSRSPGGKTALHRVLHWWRVRWPLAVVVLATGSLYITLSIALNAHLLTSGFDLGVYYEALRGYAHFGLPVVALKGPHYDLLGDHFEPMVAILIPSYWIWENPSVLLVDQGVLVALSVIPVWMFTERRFGTSRGPDRITTTCLVAGYATAWEIQSLVGFDFHSLAFAIPILAVAIERADAGRWRSATVWILMLLLVKEDLSLVVAAFGLYAVLRGRRCLGVALVALGAAAFGVLVDVVVPAFAAGPYPHWSYGELGPGPWPALRYVVLHPFMTMRVIVTPRIKVGLLAWVFLPGALLSLLSPIVVLAAPAILERVLSERAALWQTRFQYSAPLAPIVGMAVIDGLWRLSSWLGLQYSGYTARLPSADALRMLRGKNTRLAAILPRGEAVAVAAIGLWVAAVGITVHFPVSLLLANDLFLFKPDPSVQAVDAAERLLPLGVTVATTDNLVPRLLNRDKPVVLTADSVCGLWALAWTEVTQYPYVSGAQMTGQLRDMEAHGWRLLYDRADIVLLHDEGRSGIYVCRSDDPLLAPE